MANSQHRQYPLPEPSNNISDDVLLLQEALRMVDGDVHALMTLITAMAPYEHRHEIGDVEGLTSALAGMAAKDHQHGLDDLTDVAGATTAPPGSILYKGPNQLWIIGDPASVLGAHEHTIANIQELEAQLGALLLKSGIDAELASPVKAAPDEADTLVAINSQNGKRTRFSWTSIKNVLAATFLTRAGNLDGVTDKASARDNLGALAKSEARNGAVLHRNVAQLGGTSSPTTGALRIQLPSYTNSMLAMRVAVFNYVTGQMQEWVLAGYTYTVGPTWFNTSAYSIGGTAARNLPVAFAIDGGKPVIYIGITSTTWSYPQVFVTELMVGYSGLALDAQSIGLSFGARAGNIQTTHESVLVGGARTVSVNAPAGGADGDIWYQV